MLLAAAVVLVAGCDTGARTPRRSDGGGEGGGWLTVHEGADPDNRGSVVRISLDTVGVRRRADRTYVAWFETRHSVPRVEGGRPFDRELIRLVLRCGGDGSAGAPATTAVAFKTIDALLLNGDAPPVYQEGTALADLDQRVAWRPVKPGTADVIAFSAVCARA